MHQIFMLISAIYILIANGGLTNDVISNQQVKPKAYQCHFQNHNGVWEIASNLGEGQSNLGQIRKSTSMIYVLEKTPKGIYTSNH